jgi:hypothetical protein
MPGVKKVTRSPAGRVEALHFKSKSEELDSGLRRNDEHGRGYRAEARNAASTGATCASRPSARATRASLSDISTFPLAHNVA